jgi:hypothetical protein
MEDNTQGNPEAVDNAVLGSDGEDFFSALEDDVNSIVQDNEPEVKKNVETPVQQDPTSSQTKAEVSQNLEVENLKKRYSDSSREAQNLKAQLNQLKPFVPVLDAMKQDSGLVSHVKQYFEKGGAVSQNVKEQLKLDEDFEFDPDEMVSNPNSDSRKVFDNMVNNIVNKKADELINMQQQAHVQETQNQNTKIAAAQFMKKHGMTASEFKAFTQEAQQKMNAQGITFDDMYMLVNQGKVNQNVANATKNDMLNQMKTVRDIPVSASSANNAGQPVKQNDAVFDALLNSDGNIEELLG